MQRVLHLNTQFASMGGVEAVLRAHHDRDAQAGMESRFVAFWERPDPAWPRCRALDFRRGMSVREARQKLADAWPGFLPEVAFHHTIWGQPYWSELDQAPRRALFLHSDVPGLEGRLKSRMPLMDGVVAVSDRLLERARAAAPAWEPDRFLRIHYPVFGPDSPPPPKSAPGQRPLVLGYAGRLSREQKRVERFVELAAILNRASLNWRLEFLGDGEERSYLEAQLPDRDRFRFHGRLEGAAYWEVLDTWDALVLVSDYEGTPIALLEAMARGVIPLHPKLASGGDAYAEGIDAELSYRAGDMDDLARRLVSLAAWPAQRWFQAGARARGLMSAHAGSIYLGAVRDFAHRIASLPILPKPPARSWRFPFDRFSFAQWEWILRTFRRNG